MVLEKQDCQERKKVVYTKRVCQDTAISLKAEFQRLFATSNAHLIDEEVLMNIDNKIRSRGTTCRAPTGVRSDATVERTAAL